MPQREAAADERAAAAAGDTVDDQPAREQLLEHAYVGERARTAARQDEPERAPGQPPRQRLDHRGLRVRPADDMRVARRERVEPRVEPVTARLDHDELAALQAWAVGQPAC